MAWSSGFWNPEDDDVGVQVAKVVSSGSPLLKQARGLGAAFANARGVGNSSIAAGATQDSLYKVAMPIASQNAQQIAQKNLSALEANQQMRYGTTLQQQQDTAALERLNLQIGSTEKMAGADRAAAMDQLNLQIKAQASRDLVDNEAQMLRLQTQLGSAAGQQATALEAEMARLQAQIAGNKELSASNNAAELARTQLQLAQQSQLAGNELASREKLSAAELAQQRSNLEFQTGAQTAESAAERASREALAASANEADMARLNTQLGAAASESAAERASREALQVQSSAAEKERLGMQIGGQSMLADKETASKLALQQLSGAQSLDLARFNSTNEKDLQALRGDQAMALQVVTGKQQAELQMANLSAGNQERLAAASTSINASYMAAMQALMANENIPLAAREAAAADFQKAAESAYGVIEQIYGVDLAWAENTVKNGAVPAQTGGLGSAMVASPETAVSPADVGVAPGAPGYKYGGGFGFDIADQYRNQVFA